MSDDAERRIKELEHQLAQAAETERHLRAYRAPLRKIAELEAQLAMLANTAPDQMVGKLQAELMVRAAEISEWRRKTTAMTKQLKAIERVRVEVAERDRERHEKQQLEIKRLYARVGELEGVLNRVRAWEKLGWHINDQARCSLIAILDGKPLAQGAK